MSSLKFSNHYGIMSDDKTPKYEMPNNFKIIDINRCTLHETCKRELSSKA